ncbi:MAG: SufS family cysteine desulfurase [Pirellula sp.]|jgi:cysteine desulfurase/selenocysteine lyase
MIDTIEEIQSEFEDLETAEERIQTLIELGKSLPPLPEEYCTEQYRVVGCQSMVWFVPRWDDGRLFFNASSDAPMVRGLAAVLVSAYSGKTPDEILSYPIESFFETLHLKSFLSPLRSNGFNSMVAKIREHALSKSSRSTATSRNGRSHGQTVLDDYGPIQSNIESIRKDFPVLLTKLESGHQIVYLDNAASSQRPISVIDSISQLYSEHYANVHRSGHEFAARTTIKVEESRLAVSSFINAPTSEQVIFTSGATSAINLVAQTWGRTQLRQGDEIILTEMEHHSNIVPWQQLAQGCGLKINWVPVREDYELDVDAYQSMLTPRTKIVAVTAVSNVLGTINPVQEIVSLARKSGARVLVDAAQAVPHGELDVQHWDADFVVFSGHKMLAATGVGVLYGKKECLELMPAWQGGGNMIQSVSFDGFTQAGLPHKFEAGTPAIAEIISMKPAIEYLSQFGAERLLEHERTLSRIAIEGLRKIDRIRVYASDSENRAGIVTFVCDGIHGEEIAKLLDARGIAIRVGHHCAMPLHHKLGINSSCRASFYLYNTREEAEQLVEGVKDAIKFLKR